MADDDELDARDGFLMAMLGLVSLADEALASGAAPPVTPPDPPAPRDEGPLLR